MSTAVINRNFVFSLVFDSSTKYPEGIVAGHTRNFGNFDECYQISTTTGGYTSDSSTEEIGGKYCLIKVEYQKLNTSNDHVGPWTLEFDPNTSVWESIKEKGDYRRVKRYLLELALCVPDVCSALDIETALKEPLRKIGIEQQLIIKTGIKGNCQSRKDSREFSTSAKIYCYIILGLFLLVGVGTWYDMKNLEVSKNKSLGIDILLCFSAQRNYRSITEIKYNHPGLDSIHFWRVFFACGSVFGHRMLQHSANPTINAELVEYSFTLPHLMLVYNGPLIIEFFFTFGGILHGYHMLVELDKRKKMNFIAPILIRYFRFTSSYCAVVFFIALVLPHLGSGPYWESKIGVDSSSCADNWWTNILYINNYVNTDKLCMFQTWYLAVDYHLYIIGLFVVYFFWKMPRRMGYLFLITIIIGGSSVSFYLSYFKNVAPIYRAFMCTHDVKEDPHFIEHYIKTHERLSTYFVGVLGGAIIYDHSLSPWSIPKPWKHSPFLVIAIIIICKTLTVGLNFYNPTVIPTPMETALYASLSKLVIAVVAVLFTVHMTVIDKSDYYHNIVNPRWAQPLAKLTFGVFLVHNIHQSYDIGVMRNGRTFSIHNAIRDIVVDVVFSFFFAFILALVIEGPFRKIEKRLTAGRSHKREVVDLEELESTKKLD